MDLSLENFSPTRLELIKIAAESHGLELTDPFNKDQYKRVEDAKNNLVHVRNDITKTGKTIRDAEEDSSKMRNRIMMQMAGRR